MYICSVHLVFFSKKHYQAINSCSNNLTKWILGASYQSPDRVSQ